MEPKSSSPEMNSPAVERQSEVLPSLPTPETTPEAPLASPETGSTSPEKAAEYAAQAQAGMAAQPIPISLPTPLAAQPADDNQAVPANDSPTVAADDDLIEKEWVDKAKQIINQTRDDPARREKEVGRLQADYLKKRYGKELGASPE